MTSVVLLPLFFNLLSVRSDHPTVKNPPVVSICTWNTVECFQGPMSSLAAPCSGPALCTTDLWTHRSPLCSFSQPPSLKYSWPEFLHSSFLLLKLRPRLEHQSFLDTSLCPSYLKQSPFISFPSCFLVSILFNSLLTP